ncbi:MAG: HigA family addiction module antidote protein [Alphaproteobacteria bacterium]|nr:HigA family addiction module antidote protein [Alphaproteobacteria bacterium]
MVGLKYERRPTTPGTILQEEFLKQRGVKISELADAIKVSQRRLSRLINGHAPVTPSMRSSYPRR